MTWPGRWCGRVGVPAPAPDGAGLALSLHEYRFGAAQANLRNLKEEPDLVQRTVTWAPAGA